MGTKPVLVPKDVFKVYKAEGSLQRVSDALLKQGVISPRTGGRFSRMAILNALNVAPGYKEWAAKQAVKSAKSSKPVAKAKVAVKPVTKPTSKRSAFAL